jgi:uncharacterized protein YkwD
MQKKLNKLAIGIAILASGLGSAIIPTAIAQPSTQEPKQFLVAQANSMIAIEQAIHNRINQYRSRNGLPPLRLDDRLSQMARTHSDAMAVGRVGFGHQGFERRGKAIQKIMGYSSMAENVAYSGGLNRPDQQAVETWLRSASHRDNIEGQFDTTGIGVALSPNGRYYFTQIFVRRN